MRGDLLCLKAAAAKAASLYGINHILLPCRVTSSVDSTWVGSPLQQQQQQLLSSSQLQHSSSVIVRIQWCRNRVTVPRAGQQLM